MQESGEEEENIHVPKRRRGHTAFGITPSCRLVRQEGFEPPTLSLEGSCSVRLSYWRAVCLLTEHFIQGISREINRDDIPLMEEYTGLIYFFPNRTGGSVPDGKSFFQEFVAHVVGSAPVF